MQSYPSVSIIVLNYQGERVIEKCVSSLLKLDYPTDKLEIIIVDNNSTDGSKKILQELDDKNKHIHIIYNKDNLGFSKGNNVGIANSNGEYVALLNNDCIVDENWIKELVILAESDEKIFSVGSKVLFYPKYSSLEIKVPENLYIKQVILKESKLNKYARKRIDIPVEYYQDKIVIDVPADPNENQVSVEIALRASRNNELQIEEFELPKEVEAVLAKHGANKYLLNLCLDVGKNTKNKIQNAGIVVFQDGYGRDIGVVVSSGKQSYEDDVGQYDKDYEVYANCGAAVMYKKSLLDKHGCLSENYFMYYEDVEIGERYREQGYKNAYCYKAVVRHLHAYSSTEWSNFFIFHAERGRLMHIAQHFPMNIFIIEYLKFVLKSILKIFIHPKNWRANLNNLVIIVSIVNLKNYFGRNREAISLNYKKIITGDWLFLRNEL